MNSMETRCVRIPLKEGRTDRFLAWLDAVRARTAEMHESMKGEGVVFEAIFLERGAAPPSGGAGDSIVFYMRARDLSAAEAAFAQSTLPIDVETRAMIAECWDVERASALTPCLELSP